MRPQLFWSRVTSTCSDLRPVESDRRHPSDHLQDDAVDAEYDGDGRSSRQAQARRAQDRAASTRYVRTLVRRRVQVVRVYRVIVLASCCIRAVVVSVLKFMAAKYTRVRRRLLNTGK